MGVAFNFSCSGFGVYVCARCGFELFYSEDARINTTEPSKPVSFVKAISNEAIIKISSETVQDMFRIACGKCRIPLGHEYFGSQTPEGKTVYDIRPQSIRFVPTKRCQVPMSFLL